MTQEPDQAPARDQRDVARYAAAIVVIAAFIALAALAIAASRSSLSIGAPVGSPTPAGGEPIPSESALLALVTSPVPTVPPAPASTPVVVPVADPDALLPPTSPLPEPVTGKPCAALSLPAPQEVGGLQNLIRLVPLFGPFSPEAFAMLPAFEPGFQVLGPLFPLFETGLDQAAPLLDPLTPVVQHLGEAGFALLGPMYAPYRQSVLDGEAQLAAYLQPLVQQLADAPGSECLVALEGVLASLAQ